MCVPVCHAVSLNLGPSVFADSRPLSRPPVCLASVRRRRRVSCLPPRSALFLPRQIFFPLSPSRSQFGRSDQLLQLMMMMMMIWSVARGARVSGLTVTGPLSILVTGKVLDTKYVAIKVTMRYNHAELTATCLSSV